MGQPMCKVPEPRSKGAGPGGPGPGGPGGSGGPGGPGPSGWPNKGRLDMVQRSHMIHIWFTYDSHMVHILLFYKFVQQKGRNRDNSNGGWIPDTDTS